MSAYLIAEVEVTDPAVFEQYRAGVPATIAAYGGKYLVRGARSTCWKEHGNQSASSSCNSTVWRA